MKNQLKSLSHNFNLIGCLMILMGITLQYFLGIMLLPISAIFVILGGVNFLIAGKIRYIEKNLEKLLKPFHE